MGFFMSGFTDSVSPRKCHRYEPFVINSLEQSQQDKLYVCVHIPFIYAYQQMEFYMEWKSG